MSKRTLGFLLVIAVLLGIGGGGIWVLTQRQAAQQPGASSEQERSFTEDEVAQHNTRTDCWTIISGEVYDLTNFIKTHPGGNDILRACGADATSFFNSRQTTDGQRVGSGTPHSQAAQQQLAQLKIGTLRRD